MAQCVNKLMIKLAQFYLRDKRSGDVVKLMNDYKVEIHVLHRGFSKN